MGMVHPSFTCEFLVFLLVCHLLEQLHAGTNDRVWILTFGEIKKNILIPSIEENENFHLKNSAPEVLWNFIFICPIDILQELFQKSYMD
jgi:hypothetical protein